MPRSVAQHADIAVPTAKRLAEVRLACRRAR